MKIAYGHMHYPPDVFWAFSLREWQACVHGYSEKTQGDRDTPLSTSELDSLIERYPDAG